MMPTSGCWSITDAGIILSNVGIRFIAGVVDYSVIVLPAALVRTDHKPFISMYPGWVVICLITYVVLNSVVMQGHTGQSLGKLHPVHLAALETVKSSKPKALQ